MSATAWTGSSQRSVQTLPDEELLGTVEVGEFDLGRVPIVSPSGDTVVIFGGGRPPIVYDVATGAAIGLFDDYTATDSWAMDPQANVGWFGTEDRTIFFDLDTAEPVAEFESPCGVMDSSADLATLLIGCDGADAQVVDRATGAVLAVLPDSASLQLRGIVLEKDGLIALIGFEGVQLFDLETGEAVTDLFAGEGNISLTGDPLVSVRSEDRIFILDTDSSGWVDTACLAAGRSLTESEWELYMPEDVACGPTCRPPTA